MPGLRSPIRLAVVNDYEIVVVGIAALLEPYRDRVEVVELDSGLGVLSDVDVILYDTFGQAQGKALDVDDLARDGRAKVVVFSWNLDRDLLKVSMARGAVGYLSKSLSAAELVDALELVAAGERVLPHEVVSTNTSTLGSWPGRDAGLTVREAEIIALVTQGLSNQEIADRSYLSINSVKTYIRTAYRKMEVTRRSQAVLWGIKHGLEPDVVRRVHDLA